MKNLTAERLREALHYDPETGRFIWRFRRNQYVDVGSVAGSDNGNGHIQIRLDGGMYLAHRLAWLYMTGSFPEQEIDHRDGQRDNNAWVNLREVTHRENMQNQRRARSDNHVGLLGVGRMGSKYRARINLDGKVKALGVFNTPEEAHAAYLSAKRIAHPGCTL